MNVKLSRFAQRVSSAEVAACYKARVVKLAGVLEQLEWLVEDESCFYISWLPALSIMANRVDLSWLDSSKNGPLLQGLQEKKSEMSAGVQKEISARVQNETTTS